ncbi:MAG: hypothetical protein EOO48_12280 [Flavobacterium sp.]|nr:MAG: hypothetical protein EOO48_12280 [Flavobacterium sp.]
MKKIVCLFLFVASSVFGQTNEKTCALLGKITSLIEREHFKPKPVDDSLSVFVFDTFVDALDENRNLFTKSEYDELKKHRLTLDDEINRQDCSFMSEFASVYKKALERKRLLIENLRKEKLDYSGTDSIKFLKDNLPFDLTEQTLERVGTNNFCEVAQDVNGVERIAAELREVAGSTRHQFFFVEEKRESFELFRMDGLETFFCENL